MNVSGFRHGKLAAGREFRHARFWHTPFEVVL